MQALVQAQSRVTHEMKSDADDQREPMTKVRSIEMATQSLRELNGGWGDDMATRNGRRDTSYMVTGKEESYSRKCATQRMGWSRQRAGGGSCNEGDALVNKVSVS